jgi:excisionase family DNA binding protein
MTVPPAQQLPPTALLGNGQFYTRDHATVTLYRVVRYGVQVLRLKGAVNPDILQLLADLKRAADEVLRSAGPHTQGRKAGCVSSSSPDDLDLISTEEAAALLGVGVRYVRKVAHRLDGRRVGGRWIFPRQAVAEYARKDDLDEQARQAVEGGG